MQLKDVPSIGCHTTPLGLLQLGAGCLRSRCQGELDGVGVGLGTVVGDIIEGV